MKDKIFIHYLDREDGKDLDVVGYFEYLGSEENFLVVKTEKNTIRIPYGRIIKVKGAVKLK